MRSLRGAQTVVGMAGWRKEDESAWERDDMLLDEGGKRVAGQASVIDGDACPHALVA